MIDLNRVLDRYHKELLVVLACGEDARAQRRQLDIRLASCKRGPYQHTVWLDGIAKNLNAGGSVQLVKDGETQNFLEIPSDQGPMHFAPFFGTFLNGQYFIHQKGPERDSAPPLQMALFELSGPVLSELYPYALLVPPAMERTLAYELHLVLGTQPANGGGSWRSGIRHFGEPYIVRMPEDGEPAPVEDVPFSPASM